MGWETVRLPDNAGCYVARHEGRMSITDPREKPENKKENSSRELRKGYPTTVGNPANGWGRMRKATDRKGEKQKAKKELEREGKSR